MIRVQDVVVFQGSGDERSALGPSISYPVIVKGAPIGTLPVPTRAGYTFDGWWTMRYGGTKISKTDCMMEDIVCYAHWTDNTSMIYNLQIDNNGVLIGVYPNGATEISLPCTVRSIGRFAFSYGCERLSRVIIPDTVTNISDYAFQGCSSLREVVLPDDIRRIGCKAFCNCVSLNDVFIGKGCMEIAEAAFEGCNSLTNMTLPFVGARRGNAIANSPEYDYSFSFGYIFGKKSSGYELDLYHQRVYDAENGVKQYFSHCRTATCWAYNYAIFGIPSTLKSVTITDDTILGYGAFSGCKNLTKVAIATKQIEDIAFEGCGSLSEVTMLGVCPSVSDSAFGDVASRCVVRLPREHSTYQITDGEWQGMKVVSEPEFVIEDGCLISVSLNDTSMLVIPDTVKRIGVNAFLDCSGLKSVTIPYSVKSIGYGAFWSCDNLVDVKMEYGVAEIGEYAFSYCSNLRSVTIPNSVTNIGSYAFR